MGVSRTNATLPKPQSTPRKWAQFYFLRPLVYFLKINNITNQDLSDALGVRFNHVTPWFLKGDGFRNPTLADLRKIYRTFEKSDYMSSGLHGRKFNYAYFFEDGPFTQYERRLMIENARLKKRIQELEKVAV